MDPLDELVLLLLLAGGPPRLDAGGLVALHAALRAALDDGVSEEGPLAGALAGLGHRPDPLVGRRVTGLDQTLARLRGSGWLTRDQPGGWVLPDEPGRLLAQHLMRMPAEDVQAIRRLACEWAGVAAAHEALRGEGRSAARPGCT